MQLAASLISVMTCISQLLTQLSESHYHHNSEETKWEWQQNVFFLKEKKKQKPHNTKPPEIYSFITTFSILILMWFFPMIFTIYIKMQAVAVFSLGCGFLNTYADAWRIKPYKTNMHKIQVKLFVSK